MLQNQRFSAEVFLSRIYGLAELGFMLISFHVEDFVDMVSYLQVYVLKLYLKELILCSIRLNFVSKNYLYAKIEPKRKYK